MEGRILRFFLTLIAPMPATFEQRLFGISGIDTLDPRNIEAVLSSQFNGTLPFVPFFLLDSPLRDWVLRDEADK